MRWLSQARANSRNRCEIVAETSRFSSPPPLTNVFGLRVAVDAADCLASALHLIMVVLHRNAVTRFSSLCLIVPDEIAANHVQGVWKRVAEYETKHSAALLLNYAAFRNKRLRRTRRSLASLMIRKTASNNPSEKTCNTLRHNCPGDFAAFAALLNTLIDELIDFSPGRDSIAGSHCLLLV